MFAWLKKIFKKNDNQKTDLSESKKIPSLEE